MLKTVISRTLLCILVPIFWLLVFAAGAVSIAFWGPSQAARDLTVVTFMETSAARLIAEACFSDEEIAAILQKNTIVVSEEKTDTALIATETETAGFDPDAITIEDVTGSTYKGKMLIVNDPSRLYVASPAGFDLPSGGMRVEEMVARDNAAGGVNGGGFVDENGVGDGGTPLGIVVQNGELTYGSPDTVGTVVGFDDGHRLIVGQMSGKNALDLGIREAVSFPTPPLITNGIPAESVGTGGGLNPRTAIGQRADGSVLLLVIDGRQAHSIGAGYKDVIEVMQRYGALNAANLDGGSSTLMVYNGEIQNICASLYGSRKLPTAFLIRQVEQ